MVTSFLLVFLNKSVPDVNSYAIDFVKFLELKHVSFIAIGVFWNPNLS